MAGARMGRKAMEREGWRRGCRGLVGRQWRTHKGGAVEKLWDQSYILESSVTVWKMDQKRHHL